MENLRTLILANNQLQSWQLTIEEEPDEEDKQSMDSGDSKVGWQLLE